MEPSGMGGPPPQDPMMGGMPGGPPGEPMPPGAPPAPEDDGGGDMANPGMDAMMQAIPQVLERLKQRGMIEGTPEFNKEMVEELQNMGFAVKDPQFLGQVLQQIAGGQALPDAAAGMGGEGGGDPTQMAPEMPPGPPMPPEEGGMPPGM